MKDRLLHAFAVLCSKITQLVQWLQLDPSSEEKLTREDVEELKLLINQLDQPSDPFKLVWQDYLKLALVIALFVFSVWKCFN